MQCIVLGADAPATGDASDGDSAAVAYLPTGIVHHGAAAILIVHPVARWSTLMRLLRTAPAAKAPAITTLYGVDTVSDIPRRARPVWSRPAHADGWAQAMTAWAGALAPPEPPAAIGAAPRGGRVPGSMNDALRRKVSDVVFKKQSALKKVRQTVRLAVLIPRFAKDVALIAAPPTGLPPGAWLRP